MGCLKKKKTGWFYQIINPRLDYFSLKINVLSGKIVTPKMVGHYTNPEVIFSSEFLSLFKDWT